MNDLKFQNGLRLFRDPFRQFAQWFADARRRSGMTYPEAVCLSTISRRGRPQARMVLMKSFDSKGFVFYTNTESVKGRSLAARPHGALTFYWGKLERQVRIEGRTQIVTGAEADAYFRTRPRESRIGAWASRQSRPLKDFATLMRRFHQVARRYQGQEIPRPAHWTGYRLVPDRIEFWQAGPHRLHDRFLFARTGGRWSIRRLYP